MHRHRVRVVVFLEGLPCHYALHNHVVVRVEGVATCAERAGPACPCAALGRMGERVGTWWEGAGAGMGNAAPTAAIYDDHGG